MQYKSSAHAVVLNGKVYMGGGFSVNDEDNYIIQVYDPGSDRWSRLQECPVKWFGLAIVNQQLVLVGGYNRSGAQSTVLVWDNDSHWTTPYPNMPTARMLPAAIGYHQFLVVAGGRIGHIGLIGGGRIDQSILSTVEILNSSTK